MQELVDDDLVGSAEPLVEVLLNPRNLGQVENALELSVATPGGKKDIDSSG